MTNPTLQALVWSLDAVAWVLAVLGFAPDPWQATVLRSRAPLVLLNCSRQVGKTATSCLLALHRVTFFPGSLVVIIAPSARQTGETLRTAKGFLRRMPPEHAPVLIEESRTALGFANGSRIVALPSDEGTIRGYAGVSLVIEDEAARVGDEVHAAVRPMLATTNGRHVLLSTPAGVMGHFAELWHSTELAERVKVTAEECPRIDPAFLDRERRRLSARVFAGEYMAEFADSASSFFRSDAVLAAFVDDVAPLAGWAA